MSLFDRLQVSADAFQDQEIAAGADWLRESDSDSVIAFYSVVNDAEPESVRGLSDDELSVLCAMAKIGFHECGKLASQRAKDRRDAE